MGGGVADDSTFAYVPAAGFELGLDEDDSFGELGRSGEDGLEKQRRGDEGNVHGDESGRGERAGGSVTASLLHSRTSLFCCERIGCEITGINTFHQMDARFVAELHRDLAEAGIDGDYMGGAMLEEAVRKSAGGSANIEAGAVEDVDVPTIERRGKFEAATTDVRLVFSEEPDARVGEDGGTGLVDFLFGDEDPTGENEGAGVLAAGNQGAIDEEQVEAGFGWIGHRCLAPHCGRKSKNAERAGRRLILRHFVGRTGYGMAWQACNSVWLPMGMGTPGTLQGWP